MKSYQSIDGTIISGSIFAFDKLDGSNVRAEWHPKKGFWKFGTRTQLIDEKDKIFGESVLLMKEKEDEIGKILKDRYNPKEATCFFEFFGPNSFAGVHLSDDKKQVVLIDVSIYKQGLIQPRDFVKEFIPSTSCAKLLYTGNANNEFIKSVKERTLDGMTFEGVVCKQNRVKIHHPPVMFKIKSIDWIKKVKSLYTDEAKLKELL